MARQRQKQIFSYDEVGDVIRSATRLQQLADEKDGEGEVSMEQLREIAVELKISPELLAQAIATSERDMKQVRKRVRRKARWFRHAGVYAFVIAGIFGIDIVTGGGIDFAWFPTLGWGMALGAHGATVFSGNGSSLEQRLMARELRQ